MNVQWKRSFILIAGIVLVSCSAATSAWEFSEMRTRGATGLYFLAIPDLVKQGNSPPTVQMSRLFSMQGMVIFVLDGSPAEKAGILPNDRIISINGISASDLTHLAALEAVTRRHDVLLYRLRRGESEITTPLHVDTLFASTAWTAKTVTQLAVGLTFLSVGFLVFWKKFGDRRALVFYWMSIVSGGVFLNLPVSGSGVSMARLGFRANPLPTPEHIVASLPLLIGILLAPILLHLALIFPKENRIVSKYPGMIGWAYWLPFFSLGEFVVLAVLAAGRGRRVTLAGYAVWLACAATVAAFVLFLRAKTRGGQPRPSWKAWCINHPLITLLVSCAGLIWLELTTGIFFRFESFPVKAASTVLVLSVPSVSLMLFTFGCPVATCLAMFTSYRASGTEEKRQFKWPLWGVVVSLGGRLLLSLTVLAVVTAVGRKQLMGGPMLTAQEVLGALLAAIIPVSFAVGILKYRLMEIDLIIKRTVLYSMVTGIVVTLYFALVGGLGGLLVQLTPIKGGTVAVMATVLVAAAFLPIRNRIQNMVDRQFFRKRHDYPLILKTLQHEMTEAHSMKELPALVVESAQRALVVRAVAFFVRDESGPLRVAAKIGLADQTVARLSLDPGNASMQRLTGVVDTNELNWPPEDQARLQTLGAKLLAMVRFKGELTGILALGAKLSGETYDNEDREFLGSLADQVATAMDTQRLREQERDFERGREIQQALLPKQMPALEGYSIAGAWQPARRVSGDYYDVFSLGSGKLALCIADVAGKGLPAALLMSNLQAAVKSIATETVEPRRLCETINRVICGNVVEGRFISFFFGLLDAPARRLVYTNAGHNAPVLVRRDGAVIRLDAGGPVLGVLEDTIFAQEELALVTGDRMLLFTDGVSEAANAEQEEFGEERLTALVRQSAAENAQSLQSLVMQEVARFCANRFQDDATVVVLVVNEQAASAANA